MPEEPSELVLMRNSERSTYRRCRLKWHWTYNLRLAPEREKGALTFGTLVHEALAAYYPPGRKRGPAPAGTFEKLYTQHAREFAQWDEEGNRHDAAELGVSMLEEYVAKYGKDDHINIIQPEIPLAVDVYDRQGKYLVTWVGRGDAAYRNLQTNRLGFLEHKTAKSIPPEGDVRINTGYGEQGLSYWWGGDQVFRHQGLLKKGEHLDHVLFNWLKKSMPDDRPRNEAGHALNKPKKDALVAKARELGLSQRGTVDSLMAALQAAGEDPWQLGEPSKRQPRANLVRFPLYFGPSEMNTINQRIRGEAWEMAQVRAGKLPLLKNPTKDCDWDCPFVAACELHEMGADWQSVLDFEFVEWNPYSDHELLEEKA